LNKNRTREALKKIEVVFGWFLEGSLKETGDQEVTMARDHSSFI
jgi:hypothetical protein